MRTLSTLGPIAAELLQSDCTSQALADAGTAASEYPDEDVHLDLVTAGGESTQPDQPVAAGSDPDPINVNNNSEPLIVAPAPSHSTMRPIATSDLGSFDRFRMSQNFGGTAQVKPVLTHVPVRKAHDQEFVRTSTELILETWTYVWKDDGKCFIVAPELVHLFPQGLRPTLLVGTVNRQNVFFFWPVILKNGDETWNDWHRTGYEAMVIARKHWVRVESQRQLGAYVPHVAQTNHLPEPVWPELSLEELLHIAFRDYIIDTVDHIILKKLRGEA